MISYKIATEKDINLIVELARKAWFPTYENINSKEQNEYMFSIWYSESGLKNQMNEGQTFWLLLENDIAVGFASFSLVKNSYCKLNKIYVLPNKKGLGYGKLLLAKIEYEVQSMGISELQLNVNRNNNAVDFYKHCGYSIIKEVDEPFDHFWMNDFVMSRKFN